MRHTLEEDRTYFQDHPLDRLLEIAGEWIHSARAQIEVGALNGVSSAEEMTARARRLLELALERMDAKRLSTY